MEQTQNCGWKRGKLALSQEGFKRGKVDRKAIPDYSKIYLQSIRKKNAQTGVDKENEKQENKEEKEVETAAPMLKRHKTL